MVEEQKDIIIANPMYDAVFKALMEDNEIARYFVETIIDEEIVEIDFAKNVTDLAHESYYIQVPRIIPERYDDWNKCSRLLKLLSLFEQNYFVDKKYLKKYVYRIPKAKTETETENETETDKILKKMITKLEQIAVDPYTRRVMEEEEFMAMNIDFWKKSIDNKDSIIAAVSAELEEYKRRYGKLNGAIN